MTSSPTRTASVAASAPASPAASAAGAGSTAPESATTFALADADRAAGPRDDGRGAAGITVAAVAAGGVLALTGGLLALRRRGSRNTPVDPTGQVHGPQGRRGTHAAGPRRVE